MDETKPWRAAGKLEPLWKRLKRTDGKPGEGRREDMHVLTGINPQTLSGVNSGSRTLNRQKAELIRRLFPGEDIDLNEPSRRLSLEERVARIERRLTELATTERLEDAFREIHSVQPRVEQLEKAMTSDPPAPEAQSQ